MLSCHHFHPIRASISASSSAAQAALKFTNHPEKAVEVAKLSQLKSVVEGALLSDVERDRLPPIHTRLDWAPGIRGNIHQ